MKGRLIKFRIIDARYANNTIRHEDTKFDYRVEDEETGKLTEVGHSAHSLVNGGGKGLILQLLMNLFRPLLDWKGGANKIIHLFYNEKEKPIKYTVYAVGEFEAGKSKRLMLGIGIHPKIASREHQREGAPEIELEHILFTREYDAEEDFDIFELPLWDEEKKESISLDKWKKMIEKEYKNDIEVFNRYNYAEYERLLHSYGYTKSSIGNMIKINNQEGSVEKYFEDAKTNDGLFMEKIIPTINSQLQNSGADEEESDLVTSFVDTLKIAKQLPEMIEISSTAEIIKELMVPLKEKLIKGNELEKEREEINEKGITIYRKLNEIRKGKEKEQLSLHKQREENDARMNELRYEKENIEYIQKKEEEQETEKELLDYKEQIKENGEEVRNLRKQKLSANVDLHMKQLDRSIEKMEIWEGQKIELEQSSDLKEIADKKQFLQKEIAKRWEKIIQPKWSRMQTEAHLYLQKEEHEVALLKEEESSKTETKGTYQSNKKELEKKIKEHDINENAMADRFGVSVRFNLQDVVKRSVEQLESLQKEKAHLSEQLQKNEEVYVEASNQFSVYKERKQNSEQQIDVLQTELTAQLEKETELGESISNFLKEEVPEKKTRFYFQQKRDAVAQQVNNYRDQITRLNKQLSTHMANQELVEEGSSFDLWIPNPDVVKIKKWIEEQGIPCQFGSELLAPLSIEERGKELARNPFIPHSIILLKEGFEKLDLSPFEKELNHSLVFLFIRQEMKHEKELESTEPHLWKATPSGFLLKEKSYEMYVQPESWENWKLEIQSDTEEIANEMDLLHRLVEDGVTLTDSIAVLLAGKVTEELEASLEKEKEHKEILRVKLEELDEKMRETKREKTTILQMQEENQKKVSKETDNVRILKDWEEKCKVNEINKADLRKVGERIEQITKEIGRMREEIANLESRNKLFSNEFNTWKHKVNEKLTAIRQAVMDVALPKMETGVQVEEIEKPDLSSIIDGESEIKIGTFQTLMTQEGNLNSQIALLQQEIDREQEQKAKEIKWLNDNFPDWEDKCAVPTESIPELEGKIELLEDLLEEKQELVTALEKEESGCKSKVTYIKKDLDKFKKNILTNHKRDPEYIPGLDYETEKLRLWETEKELLEIQEKVETDETNIRNTINDIDLLLETVLIGKNTERRPSFLTEEENAKIQKNPRKYVSHWNNQKTAIENKLEFFKRELQQIFRQLVQEIDNRANIREQLKDPLRQIMTRIQASQFIKAVEIIDNILFWADKEVEKRAESKKQADEAVRFWTERATKRSQDVITGLKIMINKMKVINADGKYVEIVRLKKGYKFPSDKDIISMVIKEYCEEIIAMLVKKHSNPDKITASEVKRYVNISQIMKRVLGVFPKVEIYIPSSSLELVSEEPKEYFYKEWQVVNSGGDKSSSKSGGQTVMAHMVVISMLEKSHNDDQWTMVITDNLFGTMSAMKLVKPLFVVLEMLKIQWITVVSEIVGVQITSNFDVFYMLEPEMNKKGKEIIHSTIQRNERRFLKNRNILRTLMEEGSMRKEAE
ncbi:hypothetical protein ACLM5H_16865 [Fredinandcohnia humi]